MKGCLEFFWTWKDVVGLGSMYVCMHIKDVKEKSTTGFHPGKVAQSVKEFTAQRWVGFSESASF